MACVTVIITSHDTQPIVACCTARGAGAIALIRVSGIGTLEIADCIASLPSGLLISKVPTHTVQYGFVLDESGNKIDTVLFLVMHGPRTFTGHDTVEITTHNNLFLIDAIIDVVIKAGARLAEPGEFSKRAVLAGKMDLIQAEALNEFIQAGTMQSLKASYAQLSGSLSREVAVIEKKLLYALSLSNVSFEFIEEENLEFGTTIRNLITELIVFVDSLLEQFPLQQQLKEGARIALVGSVNAGKSSLFNALLGVKRAIVTPIAGTTRDVIEAGVYRHGEHQTLIDTAGIRATCDSIEKEGVERSRQETARADMVLIVIDSTRQLSGEESDMYDSLIQAYNEKIIVVYTKADLPRIVDYTLPCETPTIIVSVHNQKSIVQLMTMIDNARNKKLTHGRSMHYLLNQRQVRLLESLKDKLITLFSTMHTGMRYEIISHNLHDALVTISELTGKSVSEASMDAIFKEFCIGK